MNYLERIDLNIEPLLADAWLDLAWLQEFGIAFEDEVLIIEEVTL